MSSNYSSDDTDADDSSAQMERLLADPILRPLLDDLCQWLNKILGVNVDALNFTEPLQTGTDLCLLADTISKKAEEQNMKCPKLKYKTGAKPGSFQARCNIEAFLRWAKALGVRDACLFETIDLVELKYLRNVLVCLLEVSKVADIYGVEPPELVKLEKETKISWQDLIRLSMKKQDTGSAMSLSEITSTVGLLQKEVKDSEEKEIERASSVVQKWKSFTKLSVKQREDGIHAESIEDTEIVVEDISDEMIAERNSKKIRVENDSSDEDISAVDITATNDDVVVIQQELVEPVHAPPPMTEPLPYDFNIKIETVEVPVVASSPTNIQVSLGNQEMPSASVENQESNSVAFSNPAFEKSEESDDKDNSKSSEEKPVTSGDQEKKIRSGHVTWSFVLCYPAVVENPLLPLTDGQREELKKKRSIILFLGILLTLIGIALALTDGILGHGSEGGLSPLVFYIILALALICLIFGVTLITLWLVQHVKIKDDKLINSDITTPTSQGYGALID